MSITTNLFRLRDEIAEACTRVRREPNQVQIMAVSKNQPAEAIAEAVAAGQRLFGENRVQEFATKSEFFPKPWNLTPEPSFHLIGPLQNNKTAKAAELFSAIDTLDSLKTAERLNSAAQSLDKTLPVLIEIKLSPEESKHGLAPAELSTFLNDLAAFTHLRSMGLMTVPPFSDDPELARPYFRQLRQLRDDNQALCPTLTQLSMGMSHDFRVAIEEGATTVRIGTSIFGQRANTHRAIA